MSSSSEAPRCERTDLVAAYALAALDLAETKLMDTHVPMCTECQQEYQALTQVTSALIAWRAQSVPPPMPLWNRLVERIASQPQRDRIASPLPTSPISQGWPEARWEEVAAGITSKLLSTDAEMDRVSMLVRLSPGAAYPAHRHASVEELYLLEGELWIDDKKLCPGDYNRAERGTSDRRVWSASGCMCLLITSPSDELG